MIKYWIVPREDDPTQPAIIGANKEPENAMGEAPIDPVTGELEDEEWLVFMMDRGKTIVAVDNAKKMSLISSRAQAEVDREAARVTFESDLSSSKTYLDTFSKESITSIVEIQDAISNMVRISKFLIKNK